MEITHRETAPRIRVAETGPNNDDTILLIAGRTHRLMLTGKATLAMLDGACWATIEGDPTDYIVRAGEYCVLRGHGMVVIESLTPCVHLKVMGADD